MTTLNREQIDTLLNDVITLVNTDAEFMNHCKTLIPHGDTRTGEFYIQDIGYVMAIVFTNSTPPTFEMRDVDEIDRADVMIITKSEVIDLLLRGLTFEDAIFYGMVTPVGKYWLRDVIVFKEMFMYYAKNRESPEVNSIITRYFAMKGDDKNE